MTTEYDFIFREQEEKQAPQSSFFQTVLIVAVVALIAVTAFLLGVMFERRTNPANSVEMASFWQAWDIIERDYYGDLPDQDARKYGAIGGLVASLNDPFTSFAPPEIAEERRQQIDGHFGGIGVTIEVNDENQVFVTTVLPGNPAEEAGILPGDIFLQVDNLTVENWNIEMLTQTVRGEIGTEVKLTMYRPDTEETLEFRLKRAIIETPTVTSRNIDGIGYLQLGSFSGVATSQMEEHLQNLLEEDIHGLVLDLRGNGGGLLDQAVSIADLFLDEGVVLTQRDNSGNEEIYRSEAGQIAESLPLVVLVDGGTASASEVVAGALQDRERAMLVGQRTFGKGVVQLVYNLLDGSQLRVTSAAWYTPDNNAIHQKGLNPDIVVNETFDDEANDLVLQAALEYLNEGEGE